MAKGGVHPRAIAVFAHSYGVLASGETGMLAETGPRTGGRAAQAGRPGDRSGGRQGGDGRDRGGQAERRARHVDGHGQGQVAARGAARQELPGHHRRAGAGAARASTTSPLPVVFMDSFRTSDDTLAALAAHPGPGHRRAAAGLPAEPGAQAAVRRPDPGQLAGRPDAWSGARPGTATSTPRWTPPACCAPLLDQGYRYLFVSNADNLGARPDPALAAWFAASGSPFAAEFCRRTAADRKGGHLARRAERRTAGAAGIRADPAGGRGRLRRHQPAPVLQHQQPLARPGRAGRRAAGQRRCARPADHPQRQDRRPGRPDQSPR